MEGFAEFVRRASDDEIKPYAYQERIAEEGLPALLAVPTGSGKTLAAVLPWLWRRVVLRDSGTPRRLVYVLPMRTLVDQVRKDIEGWLARLGLQNAIQFQVLMGGRARDDDAWQLDPSASSILLGTQDMILSRALMRGYAEKRTRWPVSFALLHSGTQWVFDEVQLLGPGLETGAQLQWLRDALGGGEPSRTMWMSATLDQSALATVDFPPEQEPSRVGLTDADRGGQLQARLEATRTIRWLPLPDDAKAYAPALAWELLARHQRGTQTIAILNTVDRAVQVFEAIRKASPDCEVLLLHSRFRPGEREVLAERLGRHPHPGGRVIISTQVIEAGVDVTSRTLFSEAAPWSSIVQRAGRCNRGADYPEADLLWGNPPKGSAAPYEETDVKAAVAALEALEGTAVTGERLQRTAVDAPRPVYPVLRRRDLLQLFDTTPDLTEADLDVGPYIRDGDERTVFVAWRDFADRPGEEEKAPGRAELCPAPIADARGRAANPGLWVFDRVIGGWRRAGKADVIPAAVLVARASDGGYDPVLGWAPKSRTPVPPPDDLGPATGEGYGSDPLSYGSSRPVSLAEHLNDARREADEIIARFAGALDHLGPEILGSVRSAAEFHDLGKAHTVFQETMRRAFQAVGTDPGDELWAKSEQRDQNRPAIRHKRPYFRHELASALMLRDPGCRLLDGESEADLIVYLVAAHHGKVRLSIRSAPGEAERRPDGAKSEADVRGGRILGIEPGDLTPPLDFPRGVTTPQLRLDPTGLMLGGGDHGESWSARALRLRDRPDLGPFRLAFLEALVRIADWRASASYGVEVTS